MAVLNFGSKLCKVGAEGGVVRDENWDLLQNKGKQTVKIPGNQGGIAKATTGSTHWLTGPHIFNFTWKSRRFE